MCIARWLYIGSMVVLTSIYTLAKQVALYSRSVLVGILSVQEVCSVYLPDGCT